MKPKHSRESIRRDREASADEEDVGGWAVSAIISALNLTVHMIRRGNWAVEEGALWGKGNKTDTHAFKTA